MGESVEQGGGHFGIPEDLHPFSEAEIGGHDQGGFLVQRADEMEQQRATAFGERQIAEFIENHRVDLGEAACARSGFAELLFLLQLIDEIDDVNRTRCPAWTAATPRAMARWVLPVPVPRYWFSLIVLQAFDFKLDRRDEPHLNSQDLPPGKTFFQNTQSHGGDLLSGKVFANKIVDDPKYIQGSLQAGFLFRIGIGFTAIG